MKILFLAIVTLIIFQFSLIVPIYADIAVVGIIGQEGTSDGDFKNPYGIAIDSSNKIHSYDSLISIDINESIVKYCATHYEWETISLRYTTRLDDPIDVHTEYIVRQK